MKALGLNIIGLSDFHGDLHPNDPGPLRFKDQKDYFEATRRASDRDFLVTPWEEPSAFFGGHYNIMFPKRNVYWSKVRRRRGQPFTEIGSDLREGLPHRQRGRRAANDGCGRRVLVSRPSAHERHRRVSRPDPRQAYLKNDRYLGVAFKPGMGMDLSEATMCEWRCFDATDTMNNLYADSGLRPKYIIADIDTYKKSPEDDTYANFPVNYLKMDKTPGPDDDGARC